MILVSIFFFLLKLSHAAEMPHCSNNISARGSKRPMPQLLDIKTCRPLISRQTISTPPEPQPLFRLPTYFTNRGLYFNPGDCQSGQTSHVPLDLALAYYQNELKSNEGKKVMEKIDEEWQQAQLDRKAY